MAGLDGIENKLHPGDAADKDLYDLPPEEGLAIPTVASSFEQALAALDEDRAFLTAGGVFTDDMIRRLYRAEERGSRAIEHDHTPGRVRYVLLRVRLTPGTKGLLARVGLFFCRHVMYFPRHPCRRPGRGSQARHFSVSVEVSAATYACFS